MIEVEDKFRVHPGFTLPVLHGDGGPVAVVSAPRTTTLTAVYFDTEDLRLAREGITLRHRSGDGADGWQLKRPVHGARVGTRDELHEDGSLEQMPPGLRAQVTAFVRHAELGPRATLRTERTTYELIDAQGSPLAELVDDRVEALSGDHHAVTFREIEVEDRQGGAPVLDHVGGLLLGAGAVAGEFQPKVVQALGAAATTPPDPPPPAPVGRKDPARALVTATLRRHVRSLLAHDAGVRVDAQDAVHQMRVSARRLRSTLRDFAPLLDHEWGERLQDELRWLGSALAGGRNTEVVEARLRAALAALPPSLVVDDAEQRLDAMLRAEAEGARAPIDAALSSERYLDLLDDLVDAATDPRTTDLADRPCDEVLPGLMTVSWRRLAKRAEAAIRGSAEPGGYHRARIAAKRTRYLAEALVEVYAKPAKRFAARVEALQELLGEHQDAVVAAAMLRRAVDDQQLGRSAFTFGVLHAAEQHAAERARARFRVRWPKAARRRHRRWIGR